MKRAVLLYLLLTSAALAVQAAYIIQLKDGRVITADEKIFFKDDMAYFTRRGVYFYLPASRVDAAATDRLNAVVITESSSEPAPAVAAPKASNAKPMVIGDDELEVIRNRSRLANEGQLNSPEGGTSQPGAHASPKQTAQSQGGGRDALQSRLNDLLQQRAGLQQDQTGLQDQLNSLQDAWNQSPQQADRDQMQSQIDTATSQLQAVQGRIDAVQADLQTTQQQLNSAPIVVDMGNQESPTPPPASNPPKSE